MLIKLTTSLDILELVNISGGINNTKSLFFAGATLQNSSTLSKGLDALGQNITGVAENQNSQKLPPLIIEALPVLNRPLPPTFF
jgi:ABC-type uncharacterized transport system substrate-binding protein